VGLLSYPELTRVFVFGIIFFEFFFVLIFDIRLLDLELCNFFLLLSTSFSSLIFWVMF
jgi:hypothetical protein